MAVRVDPYQTLKCVDTATRTAFLLYHRQNPQIWKAFEAFALEAIQSGRRHYGAKSIMERVRWETEIRGKGEFKIGNNWTAYYARIFIAKYPEYSSFFSLRAVRGIGAMRDEHNNGTFIHY